MRQKTKLALYFITCIILLSIDTNFNTFFTIIYYLFVFANMANVIRLVTIYDYKRTRRVDNFDEIRNAFIEALEYCEIYGLDWKTNVKPIFKDGWLKGYYVIDETFSTTVARIEI